MTDDHALLDSIFANLEPEPKPSKESKSKAESKPKPDGEQATSKKRGRKLADMDPEEQARVRAQRAASGRKGNMTRRYKQLLKKKETDPAHYYAVLLAEQELKYKEQLATMQKDAPAPEPIPEREPEAKQKLEPEPEAEPGPEPTPEPKKELWKPEPLRRKEPDHSKDNPDSVAQRFTYQKGMQLI